MQDFIIQKLGFQALNFISQSVCLGIVLFRIVEGIEGLVVKASRPILGVYFRFYPCTSKAFKTKK
jgi:hypothetical protein